MAGIVAATLLCLVAALSLLPIGRTGEPTPLAEVVTPTSTAVPLAGRVVDEFTSMPIAGARVAAGDAFTTTSDSGVFVLERFPAGAEITVERDGYVPAHPAPGMPLEVALRPKQIRGIIRDARSGEPLAGARVYYNGSLLVSDAAGGFTLAPAELDARLEVKLAGYRRTAATIRKSGVLEVRLEPFVVRGLYFTHYTLGWDARREELLDLVKRTELNAVVLDVKGDRGRLSYRTGVPLAREIGAEEIMVKDVDQFLRRLKADNVYTIARIVVFKDDVLARKRPELAVKTRRGEPYVDWEGLAWVDPFLPDVWEYNIQLAEEAARKGFDEIQFDYIRFPSEGIGGNIYGQEPSETARVAAITGFVRAANKRLQQLGVFVAVDTFGWSMFLENDMGIGQLLELLALNADFVCPMVYPSSWDPGSNGVADPVSQPYDIVFQSTKRGTERIAGFRSARIRPWIQDFDDYGSRKKPYGEAEVRAQKAAVADAGAPGWMLWNAGASYTKAALDKKDTLSP